MGCGKVKQLMSLSGAGAAPEDGAHVVAIIRIGSELEFPAVNRF